MVGVDEEESMCTVHSQPQPVDLRADSKLLILLCGRIAQLVRALASHARGRRFESYCDHHGNQPLACLVKALDPS
jgi:hypothetical protein